MGSNLSNFILSKLNDENSSKSETSEFDFTMSFDHFSIPDDLLIDILSYVPAKDLIKNCRLVCKDWKSLIDGHSVWKLKCVREKKKIPAITLQTIPKHYFEKIYFHNPYGRSLIQNPCGEEGLVKWSIIQSIRDEGFAVENPPAGAEPVPQEVGSQSCFATTYYACIKYQVVDLIANGISEEVLRMDTTKIQVGEWFAARFDCASEYHLNVILLEENNTEIQSSEFKVDEFEFKHREDQWVGKEWHLVTHTFENVGRARYVFFWHSGKDCQFWDGNYGSKMTGAFVKVIV